MYQLLPDVLRKTKKRRVVGITLTNICEGADTHWCKRPRKTPGRAGSRHAVSDNMSPVLHVLVSPGTRKFVSLTTLPGAASCGAQLGCGSSPAQGRQRAAIQAMFDSPS